MDLLLLKGGTCSSPSGAMKGSVPRRGWLREMLGLRDYVEKTYTQTLYRKIA